MLYNESLDLNNVVCVHYACKNGTYNEELILDDYNLTLSYELVEGYVAGDTETPQHNFLKLDGSVITPQTLATGSTDNQAAIGKAPIIRILLTYEDKVYGTRVIAVAYIKVKIVEEETVTLDETYEIEPTTAEFDCEDGDIITTTVAQTDSILSLLNDGVGYSKKYFFGNYTPAYLTDDDGNGVEDEDGNPGVGDNDYDEDSYVVLVGLDDYTSSTPVFQWYLTASYMYENSGKTLTYPITFTYGASTVTVTLTTTLPEVDKEIDLYTSGQLRTQYWYDSYSTIYVNASVPGSDSGDDVIVSSLPGSFKYSSDGYLTINDENIDVSFYFCRDMEGTLTIGGYEVEFTLSSDSLSLYGELVKDTEGWGSELIATIDEDGVLTYNDGTSEANNLAELLLNSGTKEMYVLIGVKAAYACNEEFEIDVLINGNDHFKAIITRPINIDAESEAVFADGSGASYVGATVEIEDLLTLTDWNDKDPDFYTNSYSADFYDYYGITLYDNITVDTDDVYIVGMDGDEQTFDDTYQKLTYENGVLTYVNNGTTISGSNYFYFIIPVTISYDWGEVTQDVKVKVVSLATYEADYAE